MQFKNIRDDVVRIGTPFHFPNFDQIVLYAELLENEKIKITDDGFTMFELKTSGIDIYRSPKRQRIFESHLSSYGVSYDKHTQELFIESSIDSFAVCKHRLIQLILFISDMYMLNKQTVTNIFTDDVASFFDDHHISYSRDISIVGRDGMTHTFDFLITKQRGEDERLIKTVSKPNNTNFIKAIATDVNQARKFRNQKSNYIVILNDNEVAVPQKNIALLEDYGIVPVPFNQRKEFLDRIA